MPAPLQDLIAQGLRDRRWDMTYLGMQVVIEGLALAAFQQIRDDAQNPLVAASNAYVLQDQGRLDAVEVWRPLGLVPAKCAEHMYDSVFMEMFRSSLFTRIVPIVKDIGLWGDTIRNGYETMGIIGFAQTDVQALQEAADTIAKDFAARRDYVQSVIDRASALEPAE